MSRRQSDAKWRREFGVVKTPQTKPWQIPTYETEGGWEHLVGLSAEEICWQLENPSLDVRSEINARRWQREKKQRQLQSRVKQWPEASVQRRIETRKFHAAHKTARERERSRGGALRSAGQALTLRRHLADTASLQPRRSGSSSSSSSRGDDSIAEAALKNSSPSSSANLRQHPVGFRDNIYLRAFAAPDPDADDVLKRDGRLCRMCGHMVQNAVYAKHLDACRSTARHLRDEPWKDRTSVWVPCPHCGDEFREALFRSHVQNCAARQRAREKKSTRGSAQTSAAPVSRFATEKERELYQQDRDVYLRIEELKPLLAAAVSAKDMSAVQRIHWDLRALYDRRLQLHSLGDEVARRVNAELQGKQKAEATAKEKKARRRKLQLLRRPRRASIEIQRWARGFLIRLRQCRKEKLWRELVAEDEERELAKIANLGLAGSEVLRPPQEKEGRGVLLLEDGTAAYDSVVRLQAYARRLAAQRILKMYRAAVQIQRWYRRTISIRQWSKVVTSQPGAMSPATRSRLHTMHTTSEYRRHRAALRIQSMMRNGVLQRQVGKVRGCAVRIQALVRSYQARAALDHQLLAAYRMQQWYRYRLAVRTAITQGSGSNRSTQSAKWFRDLRVKSRKLRVRDRSLISDRLFAALTRQKQREGPSSRSRDIEGGGVASSVLSLLHRKYRRPRKAEQQSHSAPTAGIKPGKKSTANALMRGEGGVDHERVMRHMKLYMDRQSVAVAEEKKVDQDRRIEGHAVLPKRGPRVPEPVDMDSSLIAENVSAQHQTVVAALKPSAAGNRLRAAVKKAMTPKQFFESIAEWFRNIGKKKPKLVNGGGQNILPHGADSSNANHDSVAAVSSSREEEPSDRSAKDRAQIGKEEHKVRGARQGLRGTISNQVRPIGEVEHRRAVVPHERSTSQRNRDLRRKVSIASHTEVRRNQPVNAVTANTNVVDASQLSDPSYPYGHPTKLFGAWSRYQDPTTGNSFFYNERTDISTWQRPSTPPGGRLYTSSSRAPASDDVSGAGSGPWASARRHKPRGFGRHQLSLELAEIDRLEQKETSRPGLHAARQSASVAPLSSIRSRGSARPSQRRLQGVVKRRLMKRGDKLSFQEAVKLKGFGRAIADLPSTIKMVAAFKKFGEILARPFSKDKYFRNKGKQVDRVKSRHGPAV